MPSTHAIAELKALYQSRYGITDNEAFKKVTGLLRLYKTILEPPMKMKHDHGKNIQSQMHTR